jgi:uncharacterized surface protein with fasciclin (FAS1) repeats
MDSVLTPTHVSQSIYDHCRHDPDFSLLIENIDNVRLTDYIDRFSPLTMLVMPNSAFDRVTFSTLDGGDIVNRHIFRGNLFTDQLANMTSITAVNGAVHGIEKRKNEAGYGPLGEEEEYSLYVGGAYIYEGDILTRNGVMHKVDRLIGVEFDDDATVPPPLASLAPTMTMEPTRMYGAPSPATLLVPVTWSPANNNNNNNNNAPSSQGGAGNNVGKDDAVVDGDDNDKSSSPSTAWKNKRSWIGCFIVPWFILLVIAGHCS